MQEDQKPAFWGGGGRRKSVRKGCGARKIDGKEQLDKTLQAGKLYIKN
jgi:hypothetical protein